MTSNVVTPDLTGDARQRAAKPRRMERAFWIVSLIILLTDVMFVAVNYRSTQTVLRDTLATEGARQETTFQLNLRNQGLQMQQFATYLVNQPAVRDLFFAGRQAVIDEGGGAGGERAAQLRQQLFDLISPGWQKVTGAYRVRQLHFHLGPGDVSFLRVHKPGKFGDDLSSIRHTVTRAIEQNRATHGFESGRVYAGIRGVVPVLNEDPVSGHAVVAGALEAGSSFSQMLEILAADTGSSYAVLMDRDHFYETHWPDFAARLVRERPLVDGRYIEATSDESVTRQLMADPEVRSALKKRRPVISEIAGKAFAVFSFPFRDFLRMTHAELPPVGVVLAWHDASTALAVANDSLRTNLGLGVTGFIAVEILLFTAWTLARRRMQAVIDGKTVELSATNTALQEEVSLRQNSERKLRNTQTHLETLVEQRTGSLRETVAELEREMGQRRRAERTLQQERDQAQVTLRSIVDGVITADTDCCVLYLNPAAEALTGWSLADAKGRQLNDVFRARDMERAGAPLDYDACRQGRGTRQHGENTALTRRDGTGLTVEHSMSPIVDSGGQYCGLVLVFHDDTAARELAVQLSHQASHDALTGLINRHAIERELKEALNSCRRDQSSHAFLYIDLDQFKLVNDTSGHVAGDELLRQLSKLLQHKARQTDSLARLGGDEFGLLLRNCEIDKSRTIAEGLLETLHSFRFVWEGRTFRVGASIGVASIDAHSESIECVLSAADAACYLAKEKGRSRIHISLPNDGELQVRRGEMQWVSRIQQALADDRFVLFGQAIVPVDIHSTEHPHYEILVRMVDESGELISPDAFIPAAERYGVMAEVDRWIIERTFQMMNFTQKTWPQEAVTALNVNLSGETMADPGILSFIRDGFTKYQIDPQTICFEVTETAAISNMASAIDLMGELKQDGCRFALDDFGSGLSSFGYLKALPVDYIKIDGSFVKNLDTESVDRVMVQAINEVGHAMSLKTIAEFVETESVMRALRKLGVDYAQGYGIGRPLALPENVVRFG